jgi:hypothetical protein
MRQNTNEEDIESEGMDLDEINDSDLDMLLGNMSIEKEEEEGSEGDK